MAPIARLADQEDAAEVSFLGTARAFDFVPEAQPPNVHTGPLVRDPSRAAPWESPWPADDPRPLVLVGFSTTFQNHAGCLQRVIDACAALDARVLVTLGGAVRETSVTPAANTVVVERAPHSSVMREAALVVTHGGHGPS